MRTKTLFKRELWKKQTNKKRVEVVFLCILVIVTAIVVFRSFLFEDLLFIYNDSGDDTYQSYIAIYQLMAKRFAEGQFSLYSTVIGPGSNLLSVQTVIYDPFAIPSYVIGAIFGISHIAPLLVYMQIVRILCSALAFRYFLLSFPLNAFSRNLAAYAYAFSPFATGFMGQHYMFATAPVFLALILALIERVNQNHRKALIPLAITISLLSIWSTYFLYIIMLGCGFYAVLRFFQRDKINFKSAIKWFGTLLICVFCGLAISGIVLVPSVFVMLGSSDRLQTNIPFMKKTTSAFSLLSGPEIKTHFLRFFSSQLQGTPSKWIGTPNHFLSGDYLCCALVPVGFAQYLVHLNKKPWNRPKVTTILFVGMLAISTITGLTGNVFNFFVEYATRYTILFIPILAYLIAWVMNQAFVHRSFSLKWAAVSATLFSTIVIWGCSWAESGPAISGAVMIAGIWGATLLLYFAAEPNKEKYNKAYMVGLSLLVGAGICSEGIISLTSNRSLVSKENYAATWQDVETSSVVKQYGLDENAFIRMERIFVAWTLQQAYTYSYIDYYRSLSFYSSVPNSYYNHFREEILGITRHLWDWDRRVSYAFGAVGVPFDAVTADILGLKYVVSEYPTADPAWQIISEFENKKRLYENKDITNAGLLYSNWCTQEDFNKMSAIEKQAMPAHTIVLNGGRLPTFPSDAEFEVKEMPKSWLPETLAAIDGNSTVTKTIDGFVFNTTGEEEAGIQVQLNTDKLHKEDRQIWLKATISADEEGLLNVQCVNDIIKFPSLIWNGVSRPLEAGKSTELLMKLPADAKYLQFKSSSQNNIKVSGISFLISDGHTYTNENVKIENPGLEGSVIGTVSAQKDSILMVPICTENGWSAKLDGEEVPLLVGQLAFLSIQVPPGEHSVEFIYKNPGQKTGNVLSVVGIAGLALMAYLLYRKPKISDADSI